MLRGWEAIVGEVPIVLHQLCFPSPPKANNILRTFPVLTAGKLLQDLNHVRRQELSYE